MKALATHKIIFFSLIVSLLSFNSLYSQSSKPPVLPQPNFFFCDFSIGTCHYQWDGMFAGISANAGRGKNTFSLGYDYMIEFAVFSDNKIPKVNTFYSMYHRQLFRDEDLKFTIGSGIAYNVAIERGNEINFGGPWLPSYYEGIHSTFISFPLETQLFFQQKSAGAGIKLTYFINPQRNPSTLLTFSLRFGKTK